MVLLRLCWSTVDSAFGYFHHGGSPSSARFVYLPSAEHHYRLFTRDEDSFKAWVQTQAPPECAMKALEDEAMPGAEFKTHTADGEKIHASATAHLMELWPAWSITQILWEAPDRH